MERHWRLVLLVWLGLVVAGMSIKHGWAQDWGLPIKKWVQLVENGEFAYLPAEMQSLQGERLLAEAFPNDLLNSSVVVVVRREARPLVSQDEEFIQNVLLPRLEKLRAELPDGPIVDVHTFRDPLMGKLLISQDGKASLIVVALNSEFLSWSNAPTIHEIEQMIKRLPDEIDPKTGKPIMPPGLGLALSGTATVGRDMLKANQESSKATELWTVGLVVGLLILIYRAPVLAIIPLLTVFISVQVALGLIVLLAQVPNLGYRIFWGLEVYITVVVYGAGVDYCLFLIARYKEELDRGLGLKLAIPHTLSRVGSALTASAGTVICGIGMMVFAQFGKFREAGVGIALALVIVLIASLTLTPALLRMTGRLAFWPYGRAEHISGTGWLSGTSLVNRLVERDRIHVFWEWVGHQLVRHPARILLTCVGIMLPFAIVGLVWHDYLSYGLLSELRTSNQSVIGAKAVQAHFPAGYAGPVTVLLHSPNTEFRSEEGLQKLNRLVGELQAAQEQLRLSDVRYVSHPLGLAHDDVFADIADADKQDSIGAAAKVVRRRRQEVMRRQAESYYISSTDGYDGVVTRLDLIFRDDPFSRESISQLIGLEDLLKKAIPETVGADTKLMLVGPTASIRDLKTVTDHDQIKIDLLVLAVVFLILVLLLRQPAVSAYLILSVFFSYFATLGLTFAVFLWLDPRNFAGLDWKVPMFLFTILIAIGEDYNIFLMTRIEEEQKEHGPVEGIRIALLQTGSIISSCGIIMAGTFFSLILGGTLVGMQQLGFALSSGVLLDTFVVRPLLVPAYLIMLNSGRFGRIGQYLGETRIITPADRQNLPATHDARVDLTT